MSHAIVEACSTTPVSAGPAALADAISRRIPERSFREVLCRGGWYRLGSVVDADGRRIAPNLEEWASDELGKRNNDLAALQADFAESGLRATHLNGRTRYFVAPTGSAAGDFLQLEVEEMQETIAHPLFDRDDPPATLDELVDARCAGAAEPLGPPTYHFRRLNHVGDALNRMWAQAIEPQAIHRFVADWEASSAGRATAFCNQWIVALREHLDRYRNTIVRAQPAAAINGPPPRFTARQGTNGLALDETLKAFDRHAGYPMAWFFHLVTTRAVPAWVAVTVAEDAQAGFAYLPGRDLAVVRGWLHKTYGF